jgi:hypothetical protein
MRTTIACAFILATLFVAAGNAQTTAPTTRPFEPSRETTVVLGPKRPGGTIDYVAALNELCAKGVTRDNNIAIPLLEACGRGRQGDVAALLRVRLALDMAPDAGEAFVTLHAFAEANWREADGGNWAEAENKLFELTKGPWTADQSPLAARWLDAVAKPLDTLVAGSWRDHFYVPLVCEREPATILRTQYAYLTPMRELANALKARALLRLGAGDYDGYRRDTVALLRLGRLASRAPTLIQKLVAIGCEALALSTIDAAAGGTALTAGQCEQLQADLHALPPAAPLTDCFAYAERFQMLDYLVMCAVHGPIQASRLMSGDPVNLRAIDTSAKDWNAALRRTNQWFDRLADVGSKPTFAQRSQAADAVSRDLDKLDQKYSGVFRAFMPIEERMLVIMLPSVGRAYQTETRLAVARDETEIALALRACQAREGKYPQRLADLSPKYLRSVPTDQFTDQPLIYRPDPDGAGYLLYSVGPNNRDDNGKEAEYGADDLPVRGGTSIKPGQK